MTTLAIISAIATMYFVWRCGYSLGHWDGYIKRYSEERNRRSYIIEDEPEFKEHQLN